LSLFDVNFVAEQMWVGIHKRLTETTLIVGEMYGHTDKELLRAKANCAHAMIRKILEEVPAAVFDSCALDYAEELHTHMAAISLLRLGRMRPTIVP